MSDIYTQARRVIAYLGEALHESKAKMDFILRDAQVFFLSN
jgi:hypothetical protein